MKRHPIGLALGGWSGPRKAVRNAANPGDMSGAGFFLSPGTQRPGDPTPTEGGGGGATDHPPGGGSLTLKRSWVRGDSGATRPQAPVACSCQAGVGRGTPTPSQIMSKTFLIRRRVFSAYMWASLCQFYKGGGALEDAKKQAPKQAEIHENKRK